MTARAVSKLTHPAVKTISSGALTPTRSPAPRAAPQAKAGDPCIQCGGKRVTRRSNKKLTGNGTRLDRPLWKTHVERDPFCSRACCELWHGVVTPVVRECRHCGGEFQPPTSGRGQDRIYCSTECYERAATERDRARYRRIAAERCAEAA